MILSSGINWIRINENDSRFVELEKLLQQAEKFVAIKDPRILECDYWGICRDNKEEEIVVKCSGEYHGERLAVTYNDVMRAFPELKKVMDELKIYPYIGKNYIGNWGIHKHAYGDKSKWNICVLGKGNKNATINFHEVIETTNNYSECTNQYFFHILEPNEKTKVLETIHVAPGQIYSLNTWQWHSHITKSKSNHAECFLLHFKGAITKEQVEKTLHNIDDNYSLLHQTWSLITGLFK